METGIDAALEQRGGFHLCLSERELDARFALVARHDTGSDAVAMLDRAGVMTLLPGIGPDVAGASFCAADGHVNPLQVLRALHAAFALRGGSILRERSVRSVTSERGRVVLTTATGAIGAGRVVLAAGLGNAALAPQLGLFAPVRCRSRACGRPTQGRCLPATGRRTA